MLLKHVGSRYQRKEGLGADAKDSAAVFSHRKFGLSTADEARPGAESGVLAHLNLLYLIQVLPSPSPPPALCLTIRNPPQVAAAAKGNCELRGRPGGR